MGATLVPATFLTVDEMTKSVTAALFSSLLILFGRHYILLVNFCFVLTDYFFADVGLITLNQYILLDPLLLAFMMGSILGAVKVSSEHTPEFSKVWWFWLFFTGTMLSCCISIKFVGLFVVILVGLMTISDLWSVLGDLNRPVVSYFTYFVHFSVL